MEFKTKVTEVDEAMYDSDDFIGKLYRTLFQNRNVAAMKVSHDALLEIEKKVLLFQIDIYSSLIAASFGKKEILYNLKDNFPRTKKFIDEFLEFAENICEKSLQKTTEKDSNDATIQ